MWDRAKLGKQSPHPQKKARLTEPGFFTSRYQLP